MLETVSKDFRKSTTQVVLDVDFSGILREKEEAFAKLRPLPLLPRNTRVIYIVPL